MNLLLVLFLIAVTTGFNLSVVLQVIIAAGIILAGFGYILGQVRKGSVQASSDSIDLANSEINLLKTANERLEKDIDRLKREAKADAEKHAEELGRLKGVMEQLQRERDELRKLVMGENVPQALQEFLIKVNTKTGKEIADTFKEHLEEVKTLFIERTEGLSRLDNIDEALLRINKKLEIK